MAFNSKFRATLEYGSDLVHAYSCFSCSEDGRTSQANHFCQDCVQCFCDVCLRHHDKVLKRHDVLGRTDIDKWSTATTLVGQLVRCEKHPAETLKLECKDHGQLCCHVCVSVDHR